MGEGPFVDISKARVDEQRRKMERAQADGVCPFCPENLFQYHDAGVLTEGTQWIITKNDYPYEYTDLHLLAITKYHAEKLSDLYAGAFDELQGHMVWAEEKFQIASGGIALRFGDISNTGATIRHFHAHLIVPSIDKPDDKKVRFKIG